MGYSVYKHIFPNGKIYIGVTSREPNETWNYGHAYLRKIKGKYRQPLMAEAIFEYGWDSVCSVIICEGLDKDTAYKTKHDLILKYKSNDINFGYNVIATDPFEKPTPEMFEHNPLKRSVLCVETGRVYDSIKEAAKDTGANRAKISEVCSGKRRTIGGYHWEYTDDTLKSLADIRRAEKEKSRTKLDKPVRCIDKNIIYCSMAEAERQTGICYSGISLVCHGKQKTAGGYSWEFVEESTN